MMTKKQFLSVLFLCFSSVLFAGSGWVKKKGQTYYKLNQSWVSSSFYFNSLGVLDASLSSTLFTTSFYMESGLGDNWSLELYVPFYTRHTLTREIAQGSEVVFDDALSGLGDINFGVKNSLLNKDFMSLSATFMLGVPLGTTREAEDGFLFTGDDELNGMVKLDMGIPFGSKNFAGYFNTNVGYNLRGQNFNNELGYGAELGLSAMESKFWLISRINGIRAMKGTSGEQQASVFASNVNFLNYSIEADIYMTEKLGLSVNYVGNISGNDILIAPTYNVGFFYDVK